MNAIRNVCEYFGLGHRIAPFPIRRQARPWTRGEIPVLSGCSPKPPDFVGVGTQKSGTSWWAALIEAHPQVAPNRFERKELHYLTHFFDRPLTPEDIEAYHGAFARPEGKWCGEWTPNYLASPYTLARLNEVAPEARILVMFRDPIARFASGFNHESARRFGAIIGPSVRMQVIRKYALRKESIWNGMSASQCEVLLAHVPRERLLVLQYEQCKADPQAMLERTYRFLGVEPQYKPEGIDRSVNVQPRVTDPLTDEGRTMLKDVYAKDVARLIALFPAEIDITLWPAFAGRG